MSHRIKIFMRCIILFAIIFVPCHADDFTHANSTYNAYRSNLGAANLSLAEKNYMQLHAMLPLYQNAILHPWPTIPETKKKLKIGIKNSAVFFLRERLKATHDLPEYYTRTDNVFDKFLAQAVKGFQRRHGLQADGVVGKMTLQELNVSPATRVKQIEINLQRWASLSPYLAGRFIMVNVPDYELYAYDNNEKILTMKTIVGKPDAETPELQSQIYRVVFNPYWNVPTKITQNEIVKKVQRDPSYLDTMHLKILKTDDNDTVEIDQGQVDWDAAEVNGFPYRLRQEPGLDNALGIVKFEFQNSHDVYLHDTPIKELFNQDQRALSHGCVRLENPLALVDFLMDGSPDWSDERMQDILDVNKTKYVKAYRPTPIIITYITAWVDDHGALNFRNDIYGKDL